MSARSAKARAYWRRIVAEHEETGLTVRAFCRQRQVGEHSFYQWRRRLESEVSAPTAASAPVRFALVETRGQAGTTAVAHGGGGVEVALTTGEVVRITPGTDAATVRWVLGILREPR